MLFVNSFYAISGLLLASGPLGLLAYIENLPVGPSINYVISQISQADKKIAPTHSQKLASEFACFSPLQSNFIFMFTVYVSLKKKIYVTLS